MLDEADDFRLKAFDLIWRQALATAPGLRKLASKPIAQLSKTTLPA